jgi:intracellular sulfur oxidation DsrE/DsrF family protein
MQTDLYNVEQSDIVPSGVAEVAKLQQEGFVYIKP